MSPSQWSEMFVLGFVIVVMGLIQLATTYMLYVVSGGRPLVWRKKVRVPLPLPDQSTVSAAEVEHDLGGFSQEQFDEAEETLMDRRLKMQFPGLDDKARKAAIAEIRSKGREVLGRMGPAREKGTLE